MTSVTHEVYAEIKFVETGQCLCVTVQTVAVSRQSQDDAAGLSTGAREE